MISGRDIDNLLIFVRIGHHLVDSKNGIGSRDTKALYLASMYGIEELSTNLDAGAKHDERGRYRKGGG
jgi:hypothetical protein